MLTNIAYTAKWIGKLCYQQNVSYDTKDKRVVSSVRDLDYPSLMAADNGAKALIGKFRVRITQRRTG